MPILIRHEPSQLIGDLAQSAGNFATGQANQQAYIQQGQFGLQQQAAGLNQQRFQQDVQNHQDQLALEQQQMQRGDYWNEQRYVQQAARDQQLAANRSDLVDQQYGLKSDLTGQQYDLRGGLADKNNQARTDQNNARIQSREGIAGSVDDTRRYGIDQRTGLGYDKLSQAGDLGQQRIDQMKAQLAARVAGGNPWDRRAYLNQQGQAIANNPAMRMEMQARELELKSMMSERDQLTKQVPRAFGDGQKALLARLGIVNGLISNKTGELMNRFAAAKPQDPTAPPSSPAHPGFNAIYSGPKYGAFDQDGNPVDATGGNIDDSAIQAPIDAFHPTSDAGDIEQNLRPTPAYAGSYTPSQSVGQDGSEDLMRSHVAALKAQGVPHAQIRQHLINNFPDYFDTAQEA